MQSAIRSREINDSELTAVATFLGTGLGYPTQYYLDLLNRLKVHPTPPGFPKFGYLLESGRDIVGAILMIFSTIPSRDGSMTRCNVTSWYVEPSYRSYAPVFFSRALKHKDVTYLNLSPRPSARPIIAVQGFSKYTSGQFLSIPVLHLLSHKHHGNVVDADTIPDAHFLPYERELLLAHRSYGCIGLWCIDSDRAYPFVFRKRVFKNFLPGAQLVYCNDVQDYVRFVKPIGTYLIRRGIVAVRIDSNGPIAGLIGKYFDGVEPRYFKGTQPRLGDLAYTHAAMCALAQRMH